MKKALATILAIIMCIASFPVFCLVASAETSYTADTSWYSSEDADGIFYVGSAEQWQGVAELTAGGENFENKTIVLTDDIIFNEGDASTWGNSAPAYTVSPIADFKGTFDGNGKTVSGIYINTTGGYKSPFGNIVGATIKNLTVTNSYIFATGNNSGGLVARISGPSTLSDITLTNSVNVTTGRWGGAVVGNLGSSLTMTRVEFAGQHKSNSTSNYCTTGLVGSIEGSGNLAFEECVMSGKLSANKEAGGFVSLATTTGEISIDDSVMSGELTVEGYTAGGFVGQTNTASVTINDSLMSGSVSSANASGRQGGLVGGFVGNADYNVVSITDSVFSGTVSSLRQTGGFIGSIMCAKLTGCIASGTVIGRNQGWDVGAFVGSIKKATTDSKTFEFNDCYALLGTCAQVAGATDATCVGSIFKVTYAGVTTETAISALAAGDSTGGATISSCFDMNKTFSDNLTTTMSGINTFADWVDAKNVKSDMTLPNYVIPDGLVNVVAFKMFRGLQATTPDTDGNYSLRFVALVDSLNYDSAGYLITLNGNENDPIVCTSVYEKIYGTDDGALKEYTAASPVIGGKAGQYLMVITVDGLDRNTEYTFAVTPFVSSGNATSLARTDTFTVSYAGAELSARIGG